MSGIVAQNINRQSGLIKAPEGGGAWTFISKLTSDGSDADLSFTSGIDGTYREYLFYFVNIHPQTADTQNLTFNFSDDGGSSYAVTKTTTAFQTGHAENDASAFFAYDPGSDLAQSTGVQSIFTGLSGDADHGGCGTLHLFAPSDTTFVKHFIATLHGVTYQYAYTLYTAGYGNTTSAINAIQFKMTSGEIQGGSISMYGLTT